MGYNLSLNTRTVRSHHHLKGTLGKEDSAATTSKDCLMCARRLSILHVGNPNTDSMSSLRTYGEHTVRRETALRGKWS